MGEVLSCIVHSLRLMVSVQPSTKRQGTARGLRRKPDEANQRPEFEACICAAIAGVWVSRSTPTVETRGLGVELVFTIQAAAANASSAPLLVTAGMLPDVGGACCPLMSSSTSVGYSP